MTSILSKVYLQYKSGEKELSVRSIKTLQNGIDYYVERGPPRHASTSLRAKCPTATYQCG